MPIPIECESCHRQYKVDDSAANEASECLSCGATIAPGNRVCTKCGFNTETGQREMLLLADEADELEEKKKRRWTRKPGMPLLEQLDELIKLLVVLALATSRG